MMSEEAFRTLVHSIYTDVKTTALDAIDANEAAMEKAAMKASGPAVVKEKAAKDKDEAAMKKAAKKRSKSKAASDEVAKMEAAMKPSRHDVVKSKAKINQADIDEVAKMEAAMKPSRQDARKSKAKINQADIDEVAKMEAAMKPSRQDARKSKAKINQADIEEAVAMEPSGEVDVKSKVLAEIDVAAKKANDEPALKRSGAVRVKRKSKPHREINIDEAVQKSKNEAATKPSTPVEVSSKVTTEDVVPREEAKSRAGSLAPYLADKWAMKVIRAKPVLRDVSLTNSWLKCAPQDEKKELRLRNEERARRFRELFFTRYLDQNYNVFRYTPSKSTLDVINQMRNARSPKPTRSDDTNRVDMQDILPNFPTEDKAILASQCSGEIKHVMSDEPAENKKQKNKGLMSRFFRCCGK